jgi:LPS-assembly protein
MRYFRFLMRSVFFLIIVWSLSFLRVDAAEIKITKGEGPVDIEADQLIYNREAQLYQAHGDVNVSRGNLSLKADHAQLNMATKDLMAWGNVVLREGEDVVECERLEVNLDTRLGKIYQAKLFLKDQNFHITGREAEKLGETRYRIKDGSFTTCDAKRPPWKFTVKELDVTLEGYGIAKGPVFFAENIPLIYFPIGIFPMKRERQTGILFPVVGYSSKYGPEVKNAFFWAISKDMDSTLYFDYLGERGFKEGLEYRYAITQDLNGQANFYFIDDQVFGKNRYSFFVQHQQYSPSGLYLKGDINQVSDHQYLRDFDEDLPEGPGIDSRSNRYLRSALFGGKNWDQFSFLSEGIVFDDMTRKSNDETLQKLPQISFYAHPQNLFHTPFFYDLSSSYTHFWREQGIEAHRGDLLPRISYPVRVFNVLKVESDLGLRETVYRSQDDPNHQLQGWESRETFDTGVEVSTEFFKVYDAASVSKISNVFHVAKWMHTIEPSVGYRYIPRVRQSDLPLLDEVDRIPFTNQITYGITQRLVGKPEKEGISSGPFEYGKLMIFQNYSLGDPFQTDTGGKERNFSDIQGQLWWNFGPYLSARWDSAFNPYDRQFNRFNALVHFKDRRDDAIYFQYLNTRNEIRELNVDAQVKILPPLYLFGEMRYNLLEKWWVEYVYGVEYQSQCWALGLSIKDINRSPDGTQRRELRYELYVSLLGIGSVGHKPIL